MVQLNKRYKIIGIYKITSPTGRIYIGQSWDIKTRWRDHHNSANIFLKNSYKKHGKQNHVFEILHELPIDTTQQILDAYEIFYISIYKETRFKMMNIDNGGNGIGKMSEETKKKMSKLRLGSKVPDSVRIKMSKASKDKPKSESHKQNSRFAKIGKRKPCSESRKQKLREFNKGKTLSQEHKDKIRKTLIGQKHTEQRKKNQSLAQLNRKKTLPNV